MGQVREYSAWLDADQHDISRMQVLNVFVYTANEINCLRIIR